MLVSKVFLVEYIEILVTFGNLYFNMKTVTRKMRKYFLTRKNVPDTAKCFIFINSVNTLGMVSKYSKVKQGYS